MRYIIKIGDSYLAGSADSFYLSAHQSDATRFASRGDDATLALVFGSGARFVKLRPRATAPDYLSDVDSGDSL